jgi:methylenetetrahydrofolate reductase (NADPH)
MNSPRSAAAPERRSRLIGSGEIDVSFEFFPPKNEKM